MHYKVWEEIIYPFPKFNSTTVEVWEWLSNLSLTLLDMWLFIHQYLTTREHKKAQAMCVILGLYFIVPHISEKETQSFDTCCIVQHRNQLTTNMHIQTIMWLYPPKRSLGGVYWIHPVRPSVCLSVCPSVRPSVGRCPDDNSNSFQWI